MFSMITRINESKTLTGHISCECKCKFDGRKCNINQNWNNSKCRCKCQKMYMWKNGKCSASTIGDGIIDVTKIIPRKTIKHRSKQEYLLP